MLTNLLGTAYMPSNLEGYILFFEDINENIYRVLRNLNQWLHTGSMLGVKAVVWGRFENLTGDYKELLREVSQRLCCPVFSSVDFGHGGSISPLPIGGRGVLSGKNLLWST